ncbi:hypothetical protein [Coxiella burnetii]|uniref:hypothetical protein n=1 Tax=Coxiella burnetii TaxID=777 RepID=UPI000B1E46E5|nr:hypothetical protein [Coxiella burnetii]
MDPPLLSTISFDEKKAVAFVYPASRFKLATIGALMNYARLMLIGLSASQSPRMNQLNQPQVLPYFHQPSLFRTRLNHTYDLYDYRCLCLFRFFHL